MAKLKMVAGVTYMCPSILGNDTVVKKGDVIDVPEEKMEVILSDSFLDSANNEHHYFKDVTEELGGDEKKKSTRRRATTEE
mgnify:CR=1 FL=1